MLSGHWSEISAAELQQGERPCVQCRRTKPLTAFSLYKGRTAERRKICIECECFNQQERHRRMTEQRETWQQQQRERQARRRKEWERRIALRQEQEERWRERDNWYLQQPDRQCKMCQQIQPASAFGRTSSINGFVLHTRCKTCHAALLDGRQFACCLCQKKTPRTKFLSRFNGYALCGAGTSISLCCKNCEAAFMALPEPQQCSLIRSCCQRTFPAGQVIYAEVDPETREIRYVGRTGKPGHRHTQHLRDVSPTTGRWGTEKKVWYTRGNWMHALSDKGLEPSMQILQTIENSPLVVEWEQRYIWHGIQQGWRLLNVETMNAELVARVQASYLNFLEVPFELLVQHRFFSPHGLVAFLHEWHQAM